MKYKVSGYWVDDYTGKCGETYTYEASNIEELNDKIYHLLEGGCIGGIKVEELTTWILIEDELPKNNTYVQFLNEKGQVFTGKYLAKYIVEGNIDVDDCIDHEYSDKEDKFYYPEGFYEQTLSHLDWGLCVYHGAPVTHWCLLQTETEDK